MKAPVIMETNPSKGLFLDLSETIYIDVNSDAKKIFCHTKHHSYYIVRSGYDFALTIPGTSFEEIRAGSVFVNMDYVTGFDGNKTVTIPFAGDNQIGALQVAKRHLTQFKRRYKDYILGG